MSDSIVVAEFLSKEFEDKRVLNRLSFAVESGDVIGVLGKNGAGKTTLLELILGFTPASGGNVTVFGYDSFCLPAAAKARIGFVPQSDELLENLTARDQLRVISSFYASWDSAYIDRLAKSWELDLDKRVKTMSLGQRQKLSILLALGHHPDLLMLDEPVASLDPIARRQFLEQIVDIAADGQRAVVFSSHIVSDIERLANKIWVIKDGQLIWCGDLDALKESVVRIHINTGSFADGIPVPNMVSIRHEDASSIAVIRNWNSSTQREIHSLIGGEVTVEPLSLEEIFLELHR